jgi:transcriptional regulator with XRE-family HTH domain
MADFNSVLYSIIGYRISELRKLNNHNQQELADKIDISRSSISNIESGRQQISLHLLYRICQVYNCEVHVLIPKVSEIASKVSLETNNINEIIKKHNVGNVTKKQILNLLK